MRLIDKDELKAKWAFNKDCDIMSLIESTPFTEIVTCENCKYYQDNNGGYPHEYCHWREDETPEPDDFCSLGEKIPLFANKKVEDFNMDGYGVHIKFSDGTLFDYYATDGGMSSYDIKKEKE